MEAVESFRFAEEIQSLISPPPAVSGSSFFALLGIPSNQAVELLHETLAPPAGFSPTFPTNSELIERAERFSVFAAWEAPEVSNSSGNSAAKMKVEPVDSGDGTIGNKRKEVDKSKVLGISNSSFCHGGRGYGDGFLPGIKFHGHASSNLLLHNVWIPEIPDIGNE